MRENSGALSHIIVRPNQSLTWAQMKGVFMAVAAVSITVGLGFTAMGYWPVLPFAGLELLTLGYCFYGCARRSEIREVITVDAGTVTVERGRKAPERRWQFQRHWTSVKLMSPAAAWHPSRLELREKGTRVEVGGFLTESERRQLADELIYAIN
ncbi:MAG: DUF2244 domain-containing protein [Gammaproteobacteria bacterium]|nr:DUF2244 domain-containing protein [Gammaproteobacteria bacterium]